MKMFVNAGAVKVSDVLCFGNPKSEICVEEISENSSGHIGFHANNGTWSAFYRPDERVRILRNKAN